jgi:hypothetical protein
MSHPSTDLEPYKNLIISLYNGNTQINEIASLKVQFQQEWSYPNRKLNPTRPIIMLGQVRVSN